MRDIVAESKEWQRASGRSSTNRPIFAIDGWEGRRSASFGKDGSAPFRLSYEAGDAWAEVFTSGGWAEMMPPRDKLRSQERFYLYELTQGPVASGGSETLAWDPHPGFGTVLLPVDGRAREFDVVRHGAAWTLWSATRHHWVRLQANGVEPAGLALTEYPKPDDYTIERVPRRRGRGR